MSNTSIASILALGGDKGAAVAIAASDLHTAIFHLCRAGQATPLASTYAALPNRGKAALIRAIVQDVWNQALAYYKAAKVEKKLDKSGNFVGLQADNIPFLLSDIVAALTVAVAVVKKEKSETTKPTAKEELAKAKEELETVKTERETATDTIRIERALLEEAYARIASLETDVASLQAQLTKAKAKAAKAKPAIELLALAA